MFADSRAREAEKLIGRDIHAVAQKMVSGTGNSYERAPRAQKANDPSYERNILIVRPFLISVISARD
jgi:hypothetical protein